MDSLINSGTNSLCWYLVDALVTSRICLVGSEWVYLEHGVHSWREIYFGNSTHCSTFSALGSACSLTWSNPFACFLSSKLSPSTHHLLHLQKKKETTSFWTLGNLVRPSNVPKFCIIAPPSPRRQDIKFHLQSIGGCNQISHVSPKVTWLKSTESQWESGFRNRQIRYWYRLNYSTQYDQLELE